MADGVGGTWGDKNTKAYKLLCEFTMIVEVLLSQEIQAVTLPD